VTGGLNWLADVMYVDIGNSFPFFANIQASCWSPAGDILLFAVEDDLSLYYVKFTAHDSISCE
jgi:hypothetical protein